MTPADQDQTARFKEGQVIWRRNYGRVQRCKVRKVTPKKVVIQEQCQPWEKCQEDDFYKGSEWHVTGRDLNGLFDSELSLKKDELALLDDTIAKMIADLGTARNHQADLVKEIQAMEVQPNG